MFEQIKKQVKDNFDNLSQSQAKLFHIEVDREKIVELYLNGFSEETRQSHNCTCCKQFLRNYAGIVAIKNGKVESIWDIPADLIDEEYRKSIVAVREYIYSLPVTNVFLSTIASLGTNKNLDKKREIVWGHFFIDLPRTFVYKGSETIDTALGNHRDNKSVLKRSLEEITNDACETVLDLISQNSLYRGKEFEQIVALFFKIKKEYNKIPAEAKDNFCWEQSIYLSPAICRIKNSAIGTLLYDLSEGRELDNAVNAFERMVAPTNYKRPTSLITQKMIDDAQARIKELGYTDSLDRRHATITDINVNNLLFTDKSSEIKDVFTDLQKEIQVNPKSLSKIEEVTIEHFIEKVLPTAKSVEVLIENNHLNNMVSLITASSKQAPSMFKWDNAFSWSYTGGIKGKGSRG
jgi:hypothetical protein